MKRQVAEYVQAIVVAAVFVFTWIVARSFGPAVLACMVAAGVVAWLSARRGENLPFSWSFAGIACFSLALTCAYYGGSEAFLIGAGIGGVAFLTFFFGSPEVSELKINWRPASRPAKRAARPARRGATAAVQIQPARRSKGAKPHFVGKGQQVEVGGYILTDPLIYVADCRRLDDFDASLLCLRRRIAPPRPEPPKSLGYWPQLGQVQPYQAGIYVHWLAGGRQDPNIDIGYVFLYFYGLERRSLLDGQDIESVAEEVLRLMSIYNESRSFRQYATHLIVHLVMLGRLNPDRELIDRLLGYQEGHIDEVLESMLLGYVAKERMVLSGVWALHLAAQDERSRRSVITERTNEEFAKLFVAKYRDKFVFKIAPRLGEREQAFSYHPASPSLRGGLEYASMVPDAQWPTIKGWRRQFGPVVRLYNECIEELRSYARKAKADGRDSVGAFQALPAALQEEMEHPKQGEWEALLDESTPETGVTMLPVSSLAELLEIDYRPRLTPTQSKSMGELAEALGCALEPDTRYTHKSYGWHDSVAVLRLPDTPMLPEGANYAMASTLLPLAVEVSLASGNVEDEEQRVIFDFLEERFMLGRNERLRLEAQMQLLLDEGVSLSGLKRKLSKQFSDNQRSAIGKFLVMIAGAAEGICPEEEKALEKTFKALNLDKELVSQFIVDLGFRAAEEPVVVEEGRADTGAEAIPQRAAPLDFEKIRKIQQESQEVADILIEAMGQGSAAGKTIDPASYEATVPTHLRPLFRELVGRNTWPRSEFEALARTHSTTAAAAVDQINEWADEALGEFLVEDGEPVTVNLALLSNEG